mgnify:CR=1 FL=1
MAGSLNISSESDDLVENHEINVTPFSDVILVLLIIFMVAAPLATVDVNVDLPASTSKQNDRPEDPIYLTLLADLSLALGEDAIARVALQSALDGQTEGDRQTRIFLRADKVVPYGELMKVMNLLRDAGYLSVALVGLGAEPSASENPSSTTSNPVEDANRSGVTRSTLPTVVPGADAGQ